jgi:hypothetical protein
MKRPWWARLMRQALARRKLAANLSIQRLLLPCCNERYAILSPQIMDFALIVPQDFVKALIHIWNTPEPKRKGHKGEREDSRITKKYKEIMGVYVKEIGWCPLNSLETYDDLGKVKKEKQQNSLYAVRSL